MVLPANYLEAFFITCTFSQKAKVDIPVENTFKQKSKYIASDSAFATGKEPTVLESPMSKLRRQGDQYQHKHLLHTVKDEPTTYKKFDIYGKQIESGFERLPQSPQYQHEYILQHDTVWGNGKDERNASCVEDNWSTWCSEMTVIQERARGSTPNDPSTWVEYADPETGHPYFFNTLTGETV